MDCCSNALWLTHVRVLEDGPWRLSDLTNLQVSPLGCFNFAGHTPLIVSVLGGCHELPKPSSLGQLFSSTGKSCVSKPQDDPGS